MRSKPTLWTIVGLVAALSGGGNATYGEAAPGQLPSFFEELVTQARTSAKEKYKESESSLPGFLKDMSYDAYMGIRFRPEQALWRGEGKFRVEFFPPGYLFRDPVLIHVLEEGEIRPVKFSAEMFDYGQARFPEPFPIGLSFAGFRLIYPLNHPGKLDQMAVFLGASYFRLMGAHQVLGASARALAIDTAEPTGEEFPRFTAFWIERPGPLAEQIRLWARLEGPRVAGAYQFLLKPGDTTIAEVEGALFLRAPVKKIGLAPLTSMFLFGENRTRYFPDFRPEVHDSDGLLIRTGESAWLWRPLRNPPKTHQTSTFPGATGFGLAQRDRNFDHYQDLETRQEDRPTYWVIPDDDWGAGRVELVEIPSAEERNDNIVAYWVPERKIEPGQEYRFRYSLRASRATPDHPPPTLCRVQGTRLQPSKDERTRFVLDFAGGPLPAPGSPAPSAKVQASKGTLENIVVHHNDMVGGWRMFFDVLTEGNDSVELRAWLEKDERVVSETWVYHFAKP